MTRAEQIKQRHKEIEEETELLLAEQNLKNIKSNITRGRSITVGTAFGGTTEISMRGDADAYLWILLQPVEVTELIHQLAGNIGCHIHIQPRKDFASWRNWKEGTELEWSGNKNTGYAPDGSGHPIPYQPEQINVACSVGNKMPEPEHQPGTNFNTKKEVELQDESLAVEKSINKRKSKRAPAST